MSEPELDLMLLELRAKAPAAPEGLRERVRALPEPSARRGFRVRPALVAAVAIAVALGLGAALIGGLTSSPPRKRATVLGLLVPQPGKRAPRYSIGPATPSGSFAPATTQLDALRPGSRLQNYSAVLRLRVHDLSDATKSAVRTTRKLGGYVAAANYSTSGNTGDSSLELRVPVHEVQSAIASFTELGAILSQRIAVSDLQVGLDQLDRRIAAARKVIARFEGAFTLTPAQERQLSAAHLTIYRLSQRRESLIRQGAYAKISLGLTTRKTATQPTQPGRFGRFWGDAGDILGKEAIIVLYALVAVGPFALLAALALLGERARRRRSATRLLEETG